MKRILSSIMVLFMTHVLVGCGDITDNKKQLDTSTIKSITDNVVY